MTLRHLSSPELAADGVWYIYCISISVLRKASRPEVVHKDFLRRQAQKQEIN
jgi:hypothetical protein